MYREMDELDLRNEIVLLKKQNFAVKEENNLLKVKVRKLQTQLDKRDKQMDAVLAPSKTQNYRKFINEKSATLIIKMKDQIENMEIACQEKDVAIKRLQNQLQIAKIYSQNLRLNARREKNFLNVVSTILSNRTEKDEDTSKNMSFADAEDSCEPDTKPSSSWTPAVKTCCSAFEILLGKEMSTTEECPELPESEENRDKNDNRNKNKSPESDLERAELYDSTHEEIQTLQSLFLDLIIEVNSLKNTVGKLKTENEYKKQTIREKECSIEELVKKLNMLKIYAQKKGTAKSAKNLSSRSCSNMLLSLEKICKVKSATKF